MNTRTRDEIDDLLQQCAEAIDAGRSKYFGMSYEQGIEAAIQWLTEGGEHPLED